MAGIWNASQVNDTESEDVQINVERKLMAHVPDLVVFDKYPGKIPHVHKFDGVLLFADISGFTVLTEKYTQSSEKGTDALTVTLNAYIGKIVLNILQLGGDILKFAGDAILAVWKVTKREYLCYAISQAVKCSLIIQEKCDNQLTDVGVKLRVKIAISAGKIYATYVGNEDCRYFVMAGRPVGEVNSAEKYCAAGLVVLSPNALELSEKNNIIFNTLSERFGLVRYLRHDPRKSWHECADLPDTQSRAVADKNITRIALRLDPNRQREEVLRKYITNVVERKLDDNQPLKFLSEMRQCSIVFINMAFELNQRDRSFHEKQAQNMQGAFEAVYNSVSDMQGSLNKIFMFDKGCTFLVIFGLPGDKHEEEPALALQASWRISQTLRQIKCLNYVSIGVTTGPVFCGVIGHEERHEYTVIGQKVNIAARLMMHYPGVVSCDIETLNDSKLSKDMFVDLPYKPMKGCKKFPVFQYIEGARKPIGKTVLYEPEYPIIGREEEVSIFMRELINLKDDRTLGSKRRVIVFEGEAGYGKSRVMEEIQWRASKANVRVVAFPLAINDSKTPFFTVKTLLELLLGVQSHRDTYIRENAVLCATSEEDRPLLCILNDIIEVSFPRSSKVVEMTDEIRTREMHRLVVNIVHKVAGSKFVLFALDDAQNIDDDSWKFITTLSKDSRALCVLAMRPFSPDKPPCESASQIIGHPMTMYVKLSGLPNEYMGALACQTLGVQRIPMKLEILVVERSHGVPRWCVQLLREMKKAGLILLVPITRGKASVCYSYATIEQSLIHRKIERENVLQPDIPFHEQNKAGYASKDLVVKSSAQRCSTEKLLAVKGGRSVSDVDRTGELDERMQSRDSSEKMRIGRKKRMHSWAEKLSWRRSSTSLREFLRQSSKTKLKESSSHLLEDGHREPKKDVPIECHIKPGFNIHKFPIPASIRGMALARLDRMQQYDQLIAKCAAVIGSIFSRKMLIGVVPGYQEEKFRNSIFQLLRLRVFKCASSEEAQEATSMQDKTAGRISHQITCHCNSKNASTGASQEDVAANCEQLMFINSLVQETAYDLWLENQRKSLHEACACYLETKIDEVLITGKTDDVITKQFRLSQKLAAKHHRGLASISSQFLHSKQDSSDSKERRSSWMPTGTVAGSVSTHTVVLEKHFLDPMSDVDHQEKHSENTLGLPDEGGYHRRKVSNSSVIGRINIERVGADKTKSRPLTLQGESMMDDHISEDAQALSKNLKIGTKTATGSSSVGSSVDPKMPSTAIDRIITSRRRANVDMVPSQNSTSHHMSYNPIWSQSVGLSSSDERVLFSTETEAKRLTGFQLNKLLHTPYELQDVFALLYPQLVHHWSKAANTQKTIDDLLKAGKSCIATGLLTEALHYLQDAYDIVQKLAEGSDIVAKVNVDDDNGGIDDIKVLSVSRRVKAQIQCLMGQVLFQQGKFDAALKHFLKALKFMKCSLPTNSFTIMLCLFRENYIQRLHQKNPNRYVGQADSELANKYAEEVRCLSYIWQIFLSLKTVPHRVKLAKLVALMQVNKAEAADDDLQELITSYSYMMQMHQLAGDLHQAALYENKAVLRCLELPSKLTASDLYITGHLHLVSCAIRFCFGKLAHATASGYRAYSVADTLQDLSIKILVLPILAQIHLLTDKGKPCSEVLSLLHTLSSDDDDDHAITSYYYCACMDLLLDGGFSHAQPSECVEYLQTSEAMQMGDVSRLYTRASMAVWCCRRTDTVRAKAWLELAEKILPDFFDNFHSVRSFARILETYLILFKGSIEARGPRHRDTSKLGKRCRSCLKRLSKLCKHFPVFQPRYLHFKAYFYVLTGNSSKAQEKVTQAASMAQYSGNKLDRRFALHSQQLWFSPSSLSTDEINFWENNCDKLPEWVRVDECDLSNAHYSLKIPMKRELK